MKSLNRKLMERMKTLERRKAHLEKRVSDYQGSDPSHDIAEHSALTWVIGLVKSLPSEYLRQDLYDRETKRLPK